jgi:hypothetical protein
MAKTAIILGKSAAVVVSMTDVPFSESTRTVMQEASAQHSGEASSNHARFNLEASRLKDAGFTGKEIDEIGFALLGSFKVRRDA